MMIKDKGTALANFDFNTLSALAIQLILLLVNLVDLLLQRDSLLLRQHDIEIGRVDEVVRDALNDAEIRAVLREHDMKGIALEGLRRLHAVAQESDGHLVAINCGDLWVDIVVTHLAVC